MSAGAVIALDAKKRKMHRYSSTNEVGSASSGKGPDAVAVAVAVAVHGDGIVDNRYVVSRGLRKVPLDHLPDSDPRKKKEKNARKRKKNKLKKKNK